MAYNTVNIAKTSDENLDTTLQKFWLQKKICETSHNTDNLWSREEHECESDFQDNTRRDESLMVGLSLNCRLEIINKVGLGDSSKIANKRFISLEKSLDKMRSLSAPMSQLSMNT